LAGGTNHCVCTRAQERECEKEIAHKRERERDRRTPTYRAIQDAAGARGECHVAQVGQRPASGRDREVDMVASVRLVEGRQDEVDVCVGLVARDGVKHALVREVGGLCREWKVLA